MGVTFNTQRKPGMRVSYRSSDLGIIRTAKVIQFDPDNRKEYYLRDVHTGREMRRAASQIF